MSDVAYPDQAAPAPAETTPAPTQGFDASALAPGIHQAIREGLAQSQAPQPQPGPSVQPYLNQQPQFQPPAPQRGPNGQFLPQQQADPVADLVNPYIARLVGPALQHVNQQSMAAADMSYFYRVNGSHFGGERGNELAGAVEQAFQHFQSQGQPLTRQVIFQGLTGVGGPFHDYFVEQAIQQRQQAQQRAQGAQVMGAGVGRGSAAVQPAKDPRSMSDEELEQALQNLSF